jgi:hypothetical protein
MSNETEQSRTRRFFRSWWVRAALITIAVSIVASFVNDWRWEKKWKDYEAAARARGVKILLTEFDRSSTGVPDAENFAATPLWKEVFAQNGRGPRVAKLTSVRLGPKLYERTDYTNRPTRKNLATWRASLALVKGSAKSEPAISDANAVLKGLEFLQPELDEIRDGVKRPHCVFPLDLTAEKIPHLAVFQTVAKLLSLRCDARLVSGDGAGAVDDLRTIFALAAKLDSEPTLIAGFVQMGNLSVALRAISDGLDFGGWTELQLREIESLTARVSPIRRHLLSMASERAFLNSQFAQSIDSRSAPGVPPVYGNWLAERYISSPSYARRNQLWLNMAIDEELSMWDASNDRSDQRPRMYSATKLKASWDVYLYVHAVWMWPALENSGEHALQNHAKMRMAGLACALERFRNVRGAYPESLEFLVPDFVTKLPQDPCNGEPFRYRLAPEGYLLYSVATNRKDEGGAMPADNSATSPDWRWWSPLKQ